MPLDKNKQLVEHGSHNVSRWMTWLSISLKNAAACDKWYQLQNHFITESLNANGAWEKPFVGHPRACHTQCRTKQKKKKLKKRKEKSFSLSFLVFFSKQESELRRGAKGVLPLLRAWPFGLVFAVCDWVLFSNTSFCFPSREAGAAKQNFFKKRKTLRFFIIFLKKTSSFLTLFVYRPEHGRTTRRT